MIRRVIGVSKGWARSGLRPLAQRYAPRRRDLPPELWGLSRNAAGSLTLDGVELDTLLERFGSPLHVVNAKRLDENVAEFLAVPVGSERAAEAFYSYKTNPVPAVLQRMHERGVGAEVISEYELWLALNLGVPPSRIVFNGPGKSVRSLELAVEREIGLINLNSREEAAVVADVARRLGKRPRVGLRIVVPGGWAGQFGEAVSTGAAQWALMDALSYPALEVVALHAHQGGEFSTRQQVESFVSGVLAFADDMRSATGHNFEILDFGGSLGCPTSHRLSARDLRLNRAFQTDLVPRNPRDVLSIGEYVRSVVSLVERHYALGNRPVPRVFLEPGRAMTSNAQMLLCRVTGLRDFTGTPAHAILDAGINVAEPMRGEYHQILPLRARAQKVTKTYRLVGPICTPMDVLCSAWRLPELGIGDALAIMDAGAYFVPFATSFSFPQPGIAMIDGEEVVSIRRAERFEDLISRDEPRLAAGDVKL